MARAAVAAGADGLLVEVHPEPGAAASDRDQQLTPDDFDAIARACGQFGNAGADLCAVVPDLAERLDRLEVDRGPPALEAPAYEGPVDLGATLRALLGAPNTRSNEGVIRRYDHEVQGLTAVFGRVEKGKLPVELEDPLMVNARVTGTDRHDASLRLRWSARGTSDRSWSRVVPPPTPRR